MAESSFKTRTMGRKNKKGLALSAPPPRSLTPSAGDSQIPGAIGNNADRGDTLEIGVEFRLDLRAEDLVPLKELGAGNGGTVSKVQHTATKVIMARKIIHVEANKTVRKRIVRELQIMHECNSTYIVSFYGAFMNDTGDVIMCMEYMDCGSLDAVSKNFGPVRVDVLGKIAEAVLGGLSYLWTAHRIMHRDIKPSNILLNSRGQIKICDFGVSSELEGSIAETFVGTGTYMAPERIQGSPYTVKSDVWSVGLTLMELAVGKFPFSSGDADEPGGPQGILDLLQQIVLEPAPKLPKSDAFPSILEDMIAKCLMKEPEQRPTPQELYEADPFLQAAKRTPVDLEAWAVSMMERHNRKSHLAPPLSPSTRALLQSSNNNSSNNNQTAQSTQSNSSPGSSGTNVQTPTSMDMDIGMSTLSIDDRERQRPTYPTRTTSSGNVVGLPGSVRPAPQGPLPPMPRKVGF
ncbi:kinase-like protein [Aulographum hederae CBS 113979]|uniref:Kinase-like protein n=1 Tax=Aulographum hederae CBS 113979 TaxID=1176131 RepID=A0A6G1GQM5_9PEZI|nr:kinase-like protein [Aulographum hederae CBS 113979]